MHALGILLAALPAAAQAAHHGPWEIDSDRGRLVVTQSAAVEWPGPAGQLAEKPELVLRCAGGEKEVYLYFAHGFPSKEGDLFVQFEGDADKPKKYWGAPSHDGRSFFVTGFWAKGTDGFVKSLLETKSRTVAITVKPKKKDPLPEVRFDLAGLDAALGEWLRECPLKK
jgi:hypothetical protein